MANLKELRNRITSVSSTMQITSAMKMVSAAKLKKAQDSVQQMRPYANKLKEILQNVSSTLDASENRFAEQRDVKKVLLIPISSNRGLCGGFNSSILKATRSAILEYRAEGVEVEVFGLGKKAYETLAKEYNGVGHSNGIYDNLTFDATAEIAQEVMNSFLNGKYDRVEIVYNHFRNAAVQIVTREQFLPVMPVEGGSSNQDYIYEPNKETILNDLIPTSLKIQLYKALLDSNASEHGARMTAMHKATDNASSLRNDLKLVYNKARQAAITNEILEIVGGAEALNG